MEQSPWETYSCSAIQEHLQFLKLGFRSLFATACRHFSIRLPSIPRSVSVLPVCAFLPSHACLARPSGSC